jgi:hypothetical protein
VSDQGGILEARAQARVLQARLDAVDDLAGSAICLTSCLRLLSLVVELPQGELGLPKLGWVADHLGKGQSLTEHPLRLVPLAAGQGTLPFEPPGLDQIPP